MFNNLCLQLIPTYIIIIYLQIVTYNNLINIIIIIMLSKITSILNAYELQMYLIII